LQQKVMTDDQLEGEETQRQSPPRLYINMTPCRLHTNTEADKINRSQTVQLALHTNAQVAG
jgi:hypothetical protein